MRMSMNEKSGRKHKFPLIMIILSLSFIPVILWGLLSGSVPMPLENLLEGISHFLGGEGDEIASVLIFQIRLPRILLAALVGAALAIAGACFQGLFRNPLADPFIIGASSGAALGASIALSFGGGLGLGFFTVLGLPGIASFAGSMAAVLLVFAVSKSFGNNSSPGILILAGTSVSTLCSALLSLIIVLRDRSLVQVYYWLLGSLAGAAWPRLLSALPFIALGSIFIFLSARNLDLLLQGDEAAESLGLNPFKSRFFLSMAATLSVAAAVSVSGIIGFTGLIAPHAARFFSGPSHRRLLPASALSGALLTIIADNLSRSLIPPVELPLGIITSLGGAPFFLFILSRQRKKGGFV